MITALLVAWSCAAPARAGSLLSDEQHDEDIDESVIKNAPLPPVGAIDPGPLPSRPSTEVAAAMLRIPTDLLLRSQGACDLVFARRYREAKVAFDEIGVRYPTSGVGPMGTAIMYQALMFENFDWRYDAQFRTASAQSRAQLEIGLAESGAEPLEHFVLAGISGLDAVHSLRKGDYLAALGSALTGMRALGQAEAEAPDFPDPRIGDGMYEYWRTIVTASSNLLPDFPDKRAEGLRHLMQAESGGVLLGPGASLVMAYAYIEEHDLPRALQKVDVNVARYPDCIVNNMTRGRILTSMRRYDEALAVYDRVLAQGAKNERAYYFRGIVLGRMGRMPEAIVAWNTYLAFPNPPPEYKGQTWYRVGVARQRTGDTEGARAAFTAGAGLGNEAASAALETLQ